jgi:hypothetical protein
MNVLSERNVAYLPARGERLGNLFLSETIGTVSHPLSSKDSILKFFEEGVAFLVFF